MMGGDVDLIDAINEVEVAQNEVLLPSSGRPYNPEMKSG
jgi:hypothetical protein